MYLNPLTYGHALITGTLLGGDTARATSGVAPALAAGVVLLFTLLAVLAAAAVANRTRTAGG